LLSPSFKTLLHFSFPPLHHSLYLVKTKKRRLDCTSEEFSALEEEESDTASCESPNQPSETSVVVHSVESNSSGGYFNGASKLTTKSERNGKEKELQVEAVKTHTERRERRMQRAYFGLGAGGYFGRPQFLTDESFEPLSPMEIEAQGEDFFFEMTAEQAMEKLVHRDFFNS